MKPESNDANNNRTYTCSDFIKFSGGANLRPLRSKIGTLHNQECIRTILCICAVTYMDIT